MWGVEGGEGDGGGGGGRTRPWSNVVRNGGETAEEKKQRAAKLKKAFQVKLELEGNRKGLGKGKMFTLLKDRVNDADPALISQPEIGRLLLGANVKKEEIIGIKHNEFRRGQVEILFKDGARVDLNTLKAVVEKEDMRMSVGSFGHIEEVLMIYGLPLTNDVDGLKSKIKESIEPFVKRVVSIEASKHPDADSHEIFKGKLNGNWHVVVEPKRQVGVPNFIVVDQLEKVQGRVNFKKKYNERNDMCSDCFREGHHKMAAECQGVRRWGEYVEEFFIRWNDERNKNGEEGGEEVRPSRMDMMTQELSQEKNKNQEIEQKMLEMEEQLESLKRKEKTREENVKQIEEENKILKEKVQTFENLLTERNEDDEEEELHEGNRMVDCNDDFIEEIEVIDQVLTEEKEFQSMIENNIADLKDDLSNKDGFITRDNIIDEEDPVVAEGEETSNDGETYATSNDGGGGEKSINEVVDEITDLNKDGRNVNDKNNEDLSPLSAISNTGGGGEKSKKDVVDEITDLNLKEGRTGNDKRKEDLSPLSNMNKKSKPSKLPSEGMKVWVWDKNEKYLWTVQSKKDKLPNGGCFNCKNIVGNRKSINFNEVKWEVFLVANPSTEGMDLEDPDGHTPDFQNGEEGDKGVPDPFGLPPPPPHQPSATSTPLPQRTPWQFEGYSNEK